VEERPPPTEEEQQRPAEPVAAQLPRLRIGAAVALAAAAGLAAWFVVDSRDDGSAPTRATSAPAATTASAIGPVGLSASGLQKLTGSLGQPVYWAGPEAGRRYELTRTSAGKVFVRYLPSGVKVGSRQATFLIVATYPFRKPYAALEQLSGATKVAIPDGGVAVPPRARCRSQRRGRSSPSRGRAPDRRERTRTRRAPAADPAGALRLFGRLTVRENGSPCHRHAQ
jgi:hypothetical protein